MEFQLVADTNLFFECRKLEDLPWEELGRDPIVILLTKPVLDEIDKHKKGNGRTRDRALDVFGRVRNMLTTLTTEVEIRAASPKVILRRLPHIMPDPGLKDHLDYSKTDERLVGIVSTLKNSESDVALFTDDSGPASTADAFNVPFAMIDPSWRRPAAQTDEQKRIKELETMVSSYASQEPKITIASADGADTNNTLTVQKQVGQPLTTAQIETLIERLNSRHRAREDFTPPASTTRQTVTGSVTTEYAAPNDDAINEYASVAYPGWLARCRGILSSLHESLTLDEPDLTVRVPMTNAGTRPAHKVRITFEAKGALALRRIVNEINDEDEDEDSSALEETKSPKPLPRLPAPPVPPAFKQSVTRPPADEDAGSAVTQSIQLGQSMSDISRLASSFGQFRNLANYGVTSDLMRTLTTSPLADLHRFGTIVEPTRVFLPTIQPIRFQESEHPESFYYDWSPDRAVAIGMLTCEFWRHQNAAEIFEFVIQFTSDNQVSGLVECTVEASNLTKKVTSRILVRRLIEQIDVLAVANRIVDACD